MTDVANLPITGRVATAADADWDDARQAWNLAADQQPAAVAFVEDPGDVSAVLRYAADNGLRVTAQGTGHGAAPLGSLEDTILIRATRMKDIDVDGAAGTARVEAGVLGEELGAAGQAHGRCWQPGSSPNVGTIGYTLGGGMGWLGRRYGFACNRVSMKSARCRGVGTLVATAGCRSERLHDPPFPHGTGSHASCLKIRRAVYLRSKPGNSAASPTPTARRLRVLPTTTAPWP